MRSAAESRRPQCPTGPETAPGMRNLETAFRASRGDEFKIREFFEPRLEVCKRRKSAGLRVSIRAAPRVQHTMPQSRGWLGAEPRLSHQQELPLRIRMPAVSAGQISSSPLVGANSLWPSASVLLGPAARTARKQCKV
jgi:hypothetical protein